jgi:hypothetical protein
MRYHDIEIPVDRLASFCRAHRIRKLSFYGSILRDDFGPDSDVDMLVEFEPGTKIGLLGMAGLELDLSRMVGRKLDLRTPQDLSRYFRNEVLANSVVQYANA